MVLRHSTYVFIFTYANLVMVTIDLSAFKNITQNIQITYLPLAGVNMPVGVRGLELPLGVFRPNLLAVAAARAVDAFVLVTLRIGMRDGVPASSVLAKTVVSN